MRPTGVVIFTFLKMILRTTPMTYLQLTVAAPDDSTERFFGRVATVLPDKHGNYGLGQCIGDLLRDLLNHGKSNGADSRTQTTGLTSRNSTTYLGTPNGVGSSTLAEVAYFLRDG